MKNHTLISVVIVILFSSYALAGTWQTIDKPGASGTHAYGINDGNIVGWYSQSGADHGFRYDGSTWTPIEVPGAKNTYAQGISGNSIVGYCNSNSYNHRGFLYNGSTWTTFSAPGADMTFAYAIEGNNIVGRYEDAASGNYHGFLYNGSTWTILSAPGAVQTQAFGISGGKIYGSYQDSSGFSHGFIYDGSTWTTLDVPPSPPDGNMTSGGETFLFDGDGSNIVGYYTDITYDEQGFLYNGSTWSTFDMPGAIKTGPTGISGGRIVGEYIDSSNKGHSFIYTISEPAKQASFQGLGDLPGGAYHSAAYSISANGSVVVGQSESASGTEAFRWENGVMTGLGYLPANINFSDARGVSDDGSVIVGSSAYYHNSNTIGAYKWTKSAGMVFLGDNGWSSGAMGVSADGSVIVGSNWRPDGEACRWTTTGRQDIGYYQSFAYGVSGDGSKIVGTISCSSGHAAITWDAQGNASYLVSGRTTTPYGVSADGSVVVGAIYRAGPDLLFEAAIWTDDNQIHVIYSPLNISVSAYDASADGSIVVGGAYDWDDDTRDNMAFIWDSTNGARNLKTVLTNDYGLDLTGWKLISARGISDDGLTIIGTGVNPQGFKEGWIATIFAEPATTTYPIADAGSNQVAYAWIDGIAKVNLDGSGSYNPDGNELTYRWRWSIDGNDCKASGVNPAIELPVGRHTIELVVNYGWKTSEPSQVVITVVEPINITHQKIQIRSGPKRIMTTLKLPAGIAKNQINSNSTLLFYPGEVKAISQCILQYRVRGVRYVRIFTFFDRDEILQAVGQNNPVQTCVVGQLKTGQYFYGSDTTRIINTGLRSPKHNMRDQFRH
jgi:probable HAF family extracellular repeat protein